MDFFAFWGIILYESYKNILKDQIYLDRVMMECREKTFLAVLIKHQSEQEQWNYWYGSSWHWLESKKTNHGNLHENNCNKNIVMNVWPVLSTCLVHNCIYILNLQNIFLFISLILVSWKNNVVNKIKSLTFKV